MLLLTTDHVWYDSIPYGIILKGLAFFPLLDVGISFT
jgi:hypothetical protein